MAWWLLGSNCLPRCPISAWASHRRSDLDVWLWRGLWRNFRSVPEIGRAGAPRLAIGLSHPPSPTCSMRQARWSDAATPQGATRQAHPSTPPTPNTNPAFPTPDAEGDLRSDLRTPCRAAAPPGHPPQIARRPGRSMAPSPLVGPAFIDPPRTTASAENTARTARVHMGLLNSVRQSAELQRLLHETATAGAPLSVVEVLIMHLQVAEEHLSRVRSAVEGAAQRENVCATLLRQADKAHALEEARRQGAHTPQLTMLTRNLVASISATAATCLKLLRPSSALGASPPQIDARTEAEVTEAGRELSLALGDLAVCVGECDSELNHMASHPNMSLAPAAPARGTLRPSQLASAKQQPPSRGPTTTPEDSSDPYLDSRSSAEVVPIDDPDELFADDAASRPPEPPLARAPERRLSGRRGVRQPLGTHLLQHNMMPLPTSPPPIPPQPLPPSPNEAFHSPLPSTMRTACGPPGSAVRESASLDEDESWSTSIAASPRMSHHHMPPTPSIAPPPPAAPPRLNRPSKMISRLALDNSNEPPTPSGPVRASHAAAAALHAVARDAPIHAVPAALGRISSSEPVSTEGASSGWPPTPPTPLRTEPHRYSCTSIFPLSLSNDHLSDEPAASDLLDPPDWMGGTCRPRRLCFSSRPSSSASLRPLAQAASPRGHLGAGELERLASPSPPPAPPSTPAGMRPHPHSTSNLPPPPSAPSAAKMLIDELRPSSRGSGRGGHAAGSTSRLHRAIGAASLHAVG